ncbi:NMD3 family-domain-containing protein [Globomyces pollinis-pini]|nr:NMD3 family-domain-containing protein [Globomyces pollinis-pini]
MEYLPSSNAGHQILCASCGTLIEPNAANMCLNCIRSDVDISEGIPKQATIHFCKGCDRFLSPPNIWVTAELESRELLAVCLKKLRGLNKVRLVDASFIWTEPHSRRIKVKLSIQKEVFASTILQQVFVVEYIVANQYCDACTRVDAQLTWKAVCQVRQKVTHKRTFLWLEQVILKHNAHKDTSNIQEFRDGLDFFYGHRSHCIKMCDFLSSVVPVRIKQSQELISSDIHAGTADFKFTYSVEILPVCKDDLVCLSKSMARQLSNMSQLCLCTRVSNTVTLLDPITGHHAELRGATYWESPFPALCETNDLIEFYVIDVQLESRYQKYGIATVEVSKSQDLSQTWLVRSHLGHILKPGDHCKGYFLANANFNHDNFEKMLGGKMKQGLPDVVLVRKSYPNARKRSKGRKWKLRNMVKTEELESNRTKTEKANAEKDYELFLRDIEEDPELRGMMNIFKDNDAMNQVEEVEMMDSEDEPEADFPEINMDELLEDIQEMNLDDDDEDQFVEE